MENKIVFFGTSEFAVPVLETLVKEGYETIVITTPDAPAGRDKTLTPSPVKLAAQRLGLEVLQHEKLADQAIVHRLLSFGCSLGIVAAYGKIIPAEIISLFPHGILNIHPSLLPKYRGPSPIQYALLNGDSETGVTIIKIDKQVDHGPIIESRKWEIENNIKYEELENQLAKLGTALLAKTLPDYLAGKLEPRPQDDSQATFTKMITKTDGRVDWQRDARAIYNQFRAFHQWPGIWTEWDGRTLKLLDVDISPRSYKNEYIGKIVLANSKLIIPCANQSIELRSLQLPGNKPMSAKEFINGYSRFIEKLD